MPQQAPKVDVPDVSAPTPATAPVHSQQPSGVVSPAGVQPQQPPTGGAPMPAVAMQPAGQGMEGAVSVAAPTVSAPDNVAVLDKELAEIRAQLAARDKLISDLTKEIAKLKSDTRTSAQSKPVARLDASTPVRSKEVVASMTELGIVALLNDGIVVRSDAGEDIPISVGRVSKKFGKIVKVDPEAKVLVTESKTYKLR